MENSDATTNEIATLKTIIEHWQSQCDDLWIANERLRQERDKARAVAALFEEEIAKETERMRELRTEIDKLRQQMFNNGWTYDV